MRYFDILATRSSTFCLVQVGIIWIVILFVFVLFLITSCSNFHFLDGCFLLYPLLEDYCSPACNPTAIPTVFRGLHSSSSFVVCLFVSVFVFCLFGLVFVAVCGVFGACGLSAFRLSVCAVCVLSRTLGHIPAFTGFGPQLLFSVSCYPNCDLCTSR